MVVCRHCKYAYIDYAGSRAGVPFGEKKPRGCVVHFATVKVNEPATGHKIDTPDTELRGKVEKFVGNILPTTNREYGSEALMFFLNKDGACPFFKRSWWRTLFGG